MGTAFRLMDHLNPVKPNGPRSGEECFKEFGNPLPLHLQTTRWAQTPRTDLQAKKRHRDSATASPPVLGDGLTRSSLTMLLLSATGSRILLGVFVWWGV
ncbi:hypothetical protein SO802_031604 [Lithocarpus litseifolius]|uniref:Uncharacterized protein n=1 Tax=Lithocarpus litseifolius TaxID=425828 RepID=A0AAW2BMD8_9ROSI